VESSTSSPTEENGDKKPAKRRRVSYDDGVEEGPVRPRSAPVLHKPSTNPSASIIMASHLAEDLDIFNRHLAKHRKPGGETTETSTYQTLNHDVQDPIVYLTVPRFRTGLPPGSGCGRSQLDILEQLMGPFKREVVELYFKHLHYHFPVLDEDMCALLRSGQLEKAPNNLMCVIYAHGSPLWTRSETLKMHPKPDAHYVWNKAISATLEDFLSPGMSTISTAILDQIGRPSVSIVGNITLCGKTVSLAQTFGLHRDPAKWNITENERSLRVRLWWCVLITDTWASVAYGGPPHITKGYYDVPRPTVSSLISHKANQLQKQATTCFVHFCALTELVGSIIPFIYQIEPDRVQLSQQVSHFKRELNNLEAQLPTCKSPRGSSSPIASIDSSIGLPLPNQPGSSNLWFCFLSTRLLLARVTLRAAVLEGDGALGRDRMHQLRTASSAVLDFLLSLGELQFHDFWLPYVTHLLVHAITVSLRCTVETQDPEIRNTSVTRLQRVIAHIQFARDNYDWDLATFCLERCADPVSRIASLNFREPAPPSETEMTSMAPPNGHGTTVEVPPVPTFEESNFLLSDILDPNAFDFSWEALWDTPSGMSHRLEFLSHLLWEAWWLKT
jgi:hypothetical protein